MNRLKYVLGIQVPRRLPANAAFSKSHFKGVCKRNQSDVYASKTSRFVTSRLRRINEFKGFHCTRQTRNGIESAQKQEFIQGRRNSTFQLKKAYICRRYSLRNGEKAEDSKSAKCHGSNEGLIEKEPRTYAQMIQFYNDAKYGQSDGVSSGTVIGIHKSPFSTASIVSQKWKNMSRSSRQGSIFTAGLNAFSQEAKFSSEATTIGCRSRQDDKNLLGTAGENSLVKPSLSYARLIERYSNSIIRNVDVPNRPGSLIPKRNVSTKFNKIHAVLMHPKDVVAKSFLPEVPDDATTVSDDKKENTEATDEKRWLTKVDDIMTDIKRASGGPESAEIKQTEKSVSQSANEPDQWLDRVVRAHKTKITEKRLTREIVSVDAKPIENALIEKSRPIDDPRNKRVEMSMNKGKEYVTGMQQFPGVVATNKPTNPIVDYIKRGPVKPTTTTSQGSTHSPTYAATSSGKHPQIELRMTPSQNESVVSINVDELAARSAGAAAKDHLSVVISSKKNRSGVVEASQANPNLDFGSMHVSISENTVPVKQIEFSINGKPVSELKSIVARADKLDVVSSMDKVEIRIPSRGGTAVASVAQNATPVLNLQIAAKFNEPRFQQPKGPEVKPGPPQVIPNIPPTTPTSRSPPVVPSIPPKPSRPQNMFNPNTSNSPPTQVPPPTNSVPTKSESPKVVNDVNISTNATNAKGSENVNRTDDVGSFLADKPQAPIGKDENGIRYITRTSFPTVKPDEAVLQRSNIDIPTRNGPHQRQSLNIQNPKSNVAKEDRIPSNIIPWWSSEDSFNKIKKQDNTPKIASPFDDILPPRTEEPLKLMPENEQKSNVVSKQKAASVDIKRLGTAINVKRNEKSIVDETLNVAKIPKTSIGVTRVRTQQRWIPLKAKSGVRASKYAKPTSATSKKAKYRSRNSAFIGTSSAKTDSETLTISPVHAPKIVKYVSVTPQRAGVDKRSDVNSSSLRMRQKSNDSSSKNSGDSKKGGEKTGKTPNVVQGGESRVGKANVRQSNTIAKDEKNAGQRANTPADGSSKPVAPPTTKVSPDANKEYKLPGSEAAGRKNQPNISVNEDPRIKEIMKSMKPIEKKKDGTLIDYGVIVPSRKPAGQIRQIPKVQSKDGVAQQEKIAEQKNVPDGTKIVDPKKVSPAWKVDGTTTVLEKRETKRTDEPVKTAIEKTQQKVVITVKENNVEIRKVDESTSKVPTEKSTVEKRVRTPLISVRMGSNVEIQRASESASRALPVKSLPQKKEQKPVNANVANRSESLNRPATATTGEAPLQGTVPSPPLKTIIDVANKPPTIQKKEPAGTAKSAPLAGSVVAPSNVIDQTSKKSDPGSTISQKSNAKPTGGDTPPEKNIGITGVAPLQGTINPPLAENQPGVGKSTSKGSDKDGPKNDGGPAIIKMYDTQNPGDCSKQRSSENNENTKARNDARSTYEEESDDAYVLFASNTDRPEKNLLYSSWLQRFKNRFDDDKVI